MMARLRHSNLPHVTDHFVTPDGSQYLVMEHIEGADLTEVLAEQIAPLGRPTITWWPTDPHPLARLTSLACPASHDHPHPRRQRA